MRLPPILLPLLFFLLMPLSLFADGKWLFDWPIDANAEQRDDFAANEHQPVIVSSDASKAAWINQGEWLAERLLNKNLRIGDAVHIRIFKQSRELDLYIHGGDGFELYRTYPICDMSGTLGPKRFEGDYQAPEGFYEVRVDRMHPHSDFHLAFNLGFPNEFDQAMGRTGSNIMIHGGCASRGCFAVTDYYMEQIYLLAEAALANGQDSIGVEIYPFRMTEANLATHSASRWIDFWTGLKAGHDYFLDTGLPASITHSSAGYRYSDAPAADLFDPPASAP